MFHIDNDDDDFCGIFLGFSIFWNFLVLILNSFYKGQDFALHIASLTSNPTLGINVPTFTMGMEELTQMAWANKIWFCPSLT